MTDDARLQAASPLAPPSSPSSSVKRLPELTRAAMRWAALIVAILTAAAVTLLWWPATAGLTGADLVNARLNALKIGLSIGVGSGGVVALYLAWRRQHSTEADLDNRERALAHQQDVAAATQAHHERVADDARADASARRITELYTKAVEQLGSDKAPVRLGGLYALERLAQDNETQRQTIVNVLCAYLRMPYDLPIEQDREDGASAEQCEIYRARSQEREVRLTAQRLLDDHLSPRRSLVYWGELDLDLTGAQLIDFTLTDAQIGTSTFRQATFTGNVIFYGSTFVGDTTFEGARFNHESYVELANFSNFELAQFDGKANFTGAKFEGYTKFHGATFVNDAEFEGTTFDDKAEFDVTTFRDAKFSSATFTSDATFDAATFTLATFDGATFEQDAQFTGTSFNPAAATTPMLFTVDPFASATFTYGGQFTGATMDGKPYDPTRAPFVEDDDSQPG
ncbi:pentapeptide repeat-containing protein [Amycolatopsis japonica]|uniref:pentapeptide repeat-containing protein n=1 Tax=Amycolatopsis japonica TaxID=208439 RepID=UPI003824DC7C